MNTMRMLLVALFAVVSLAAAQSNAKIVATVEGQSINEEQVVQAAAQDLARLDANRPQPQSAYDRARLEILWRVLDSIIEERLITLEAAKQQVTREQIIESEIESNVYTPSPQEVDAFYEANKAQIAAQIPGPKEQALPAVRQFMIDSSRRQMRNMLISNLRRTYRITTMLDPLRTEVATAGYPTHGPANAVVTIVEFADFECPFCGGLFPTLKLVERNYADKVRFVFRQFPLVNSHRFAQKAAEAALCANDQQRFWEFHDSLYGNQSVLDVASLKQRAVAMGLNTAEFNSCLDSSKHAETIRRDQEDARRLGVNSTPTTFINGRRLNGNQPYAAIRDIIEDELKRQAQ